MRIPTLDDVLAEQLDLETLCSDRVLKTTEICWFNAYYGMDRVLKLYANWQSDRPLKVALTHGPQFNDYVWHEEIASPVPVLLVYPDHVLDLHHHSGKVTFQTAAPFIYAQRLVDPLPSEKRKGTLFFLSHSTHWSTTKTDVALISKKLSQLPEECQPVNICVYWRDQNIGHHKAFAERGHNIFSAGHIYDPNFIFRLVYLLSLHRYACGTDMGSHIFYAVKAGVSYFHLSDIDHTFLDREAVKPVQPGPVPNAARARVEAMFRQPGPITKEQAAFVDGYVGAGHEMTRDELGRFFQFCERLDRIGLASWRGKRYAKWPQALRRTLWLAPRRTAGRVARKVLPRAARSIIGMKS
jgi:hypothetical protein